MPFFCCNCNTIAVNYKISGFEHISEKSKKSLSKTITRNSNFSVARECKDPPGGGERSPPPLGDHLHTLSNSREIRIRMIALESDFCIFGNRFKTAVSVSPLSGFSGFLVNRNRFGFGDSGSVFPVPVRFAAILIVICICTSLLNLVSAKP